MRTRTIFDAYDQVNELQREHYNTGGYRNSPARVLRASRQTFVFEAELLRRMDERDALAARFASANDKIADLENEAYHQMEMLDG